MRSNETALHPPGVMIYRSSRELLSNLKPETVYEVLMAMLDYSESGQEPTSDDPFFRLAWAAMREHLDADRRKYEQVCLSNRYHRFLREADRCLPREDCPSYEEWLSLSQGGSLSAAKTVSLLVDR